MLTDTKTIFASPVMNNAMYWFQRELHECLYDFDTEGWNGIARIVGCHIVH